MERYGELIFRSRLGDNTVGSIAVLSFTLSTSLYKLSSLDLGQCCGLRFQVIAFGMYGSTHSCESCRDLYYKRNLLLYPHRNIYGRFRRRYLLGILYHPHMRT